jgi:outer membrane lipoprotein-sorting protein
MNCTHVRRNLKAFVDDELGRLARASVARHLARCEACRAEAEAVRAMSRDISKLGAPEQSNGMREAVLAAARNGRSSPIPATGRRVRTVLFAAGGAGVLVAAALFLLFRPTTAQAALQRVIAASEAVRTCHMEEWFQYPGEERATQDLWYAEGKFRIETSQGEIQVFDGEKLHMYRPESNTVFRNVADQPFGTPFGGFTVAAMIKAEGDPEVTVEQVEQEGRTLNRFTLTQLPDERMVILADSETDLPISIEMYGKLTHGWEKLAGVDEIEYNVPLGPELFVLTPPEGAQVIDQAELGEQWRARYEQGLGRARLDGHDIVLRDFQVMTEGDVRVIWSGFPKGTVVRWPSRDGTYADNISAELVDSDGRTYLGGEPWTGAGKDMGAYFVPVQPLTSARRTYTLRIVTRRVEAGQVLISDSAVFAVDRPWHSPVEDPIYPPSSGALGTDGFTFPRGLGGVGTRADMRAEYWRERGDARQALRYYEEEIRSIDQEEPGGRLAWDTPHWLIVGQLYEQVGDVNGAREAYRRGLECDKGEDWDPGHNALTAIKEALRRLE